MTVSMNRSCHMTCCKSFAVDGTSAHICNILDTASLAVSIIIAGLAGLLILV